MVSAVNFTVAVRLSIWDTSKSVTSVIRLSARRASVITRLLSLANQMCIRDSYYSLFQISDINRSS